MSLHHTMLNAGFSDVECSIRNGWVKWKAVADNKSGWVAAYHKDMNNKRGYVPGQVYRSGGNTMHSRNADTLFAVQSSKDRKWYVGHWHYGKYPNGFDEVAGPFDNLRIAKVALELLQ